MNHLLALGHAAKRPASTGRRFSFLGCCCLFRLEVLEHLGLLADEAVPPHSHVGHLHAAHIVSRSQDGARIATAVSHGGGAEQHRAGRRRPEDCYIACT